MAADPAATLARRLQTDDTLIARFLHSPDQVCGEHGVTLDAQQVQALRQAVSGKSTQEVRDQIAAAGLRAMW